MTRFVLAGLMVALAATALVRADELDQFKEREKLLAQKWTRDVAAAVDTSRKLERANPAAARETLQGALAGVKSAAGLSDAVRDDLTRQLQARLAAVSTQFAQAKPPVTQPAPSTFPAGTQLPPTFAGGSTVAPKTSVADQAKAFLDKQNSAVTKGNTGRDERNSGFSGVMTGIQGSSIPLDRDVSLAPNHKEITAKRTPASNPKEDAMMKALGTSIDGDFSGMNFRQAIDMIVQKTGLVIVPDAGSLKEANVEYDDPVNFSVKSKITVRNALRKILGDRGLAYTASDGVLNVVTTQKARETTVVRIYPINDLVQPVIPQPQYVWTPFGPQPVAPGTFPPGTVGVTPTYAQQMGQTIAQMVTTSVDPTYWAPTGPGTVAFDPITNSLVVRASAEVHYMIGSSLGRR